MECTCEHFESGGAACYNQDEARLCELKLGRLGTFTLSQQRHPTTDPLLQQQEYTHTYTKHGRNCPYKKLSIREAFCTICPHSARLLQRRLHQAFFYHFIILAHHSSHSSTGDFSSTAEVSAVIMSAIANQIQYHDAFAHKKLHQQQKKQAQAGGGALNSHPYDPQSDINIIGKFQLEDPFNQQNNDDDNNNNNDFLQYLSNATYNNNANANANETHHHSDQEDAVDNQSLYSTPLGKSQIESPTATATATTAIDTPLPSSAKKQQQQEKKVGSLDDDDNGFNTPSKDSNEHNNKNKIVDDDFSQKNLSDLPQSKPESKSKSQLVEGEKPEKQCSAQSSESEAATAAEKSTSSSASSTKESNNEEESSTEEKKELLLTQQQKSPSEEEKTIAIAIESEGGEVLLSPSEGKEERNDSDENDSDEDDDTTVIVTLRGKFYCHQTRHYRYRYPHHHHHKHCVRLSVVEELC